MEHGVAPLGGGGLQALHTQDNIPQGALHGADLRVRHVGVDDEQILHRDGELLIQGAEAAVAVLDKKQLHAAVGVEL